MKIAIDARALVSQRPAGKKRFVINILEEWFRLDRTNQYILYLNNDFSRELPPNFLKRVIKAPNIFWHLLVIFDFIWQKPDLNFAPMSYIIPALNIFCKNIIVIHDLCVFLPIKTGLSLKIRLLERIFSKIAAKRSDKIISVSQSTKNDIIKYFHINPSKVQVIYPGLSLKQVAIPDDKIREILSRHNLSSNFILFVGTLEPRKNIIRLIEAYNILRSMSFVDTLTNRQNLKLLIVGGRGWYYQGIFAKVQELQLQKQVIFLDYLSTDGELLPCLYNSAVCFTFPSIYEGFGSPVLEAMACGCPVVTSDISSLPEVAGGAAILVNPNDANEIAGALNKLLINEPLRQELKKQGLERAKNFSWQKTAQEILKVLCDQ